MAVRVGVAVGSDVAVGCAVKVAATEFAIAWAAAVAVPAKSGVAVGVQVAVPVGVSVGCAVKVAATIMLIRFISAVALAARSVKAKALRVAADALEASEADLEIVDGVVAVRVDDDRDPVREWVFSTRTPDRVIAAIRRAQRG